MSDTRLIKEFSKKDVTRLRNLFSGNTGAATTTQVGYIKKEVERKEGDIWEESGRKWTIKNGIKQTYTQLDGIKKIFSTPMLCPECSSRMKSPVDKKMYHLHGKCFSCVQSFETKLKLEGKYEAYAKNIMFSNAKTFVDEAREYIDEVESTVHSYYTESGVKEDWSGPQVNKGVISKMREELSDLEEEVNKNL